MRGPSYTVSTTRTVPENACALGRSLSGGCGCLTAAGRANSSAGSLASASSLGGGGRNTKVWPLMASGRVRELVEIRERRSPRIVISA